MNTHKEVLARSNNWQLVSLLNGRRYLVQVYNQQDGRWFTIKIETELEKAMWLYSRKSQ